MSEWIEQLLGFVASALGLVTVPDAAALGLAIALVAVGVLAVALTLGAVPIESGGSPHPLRAIGLSALLTQSDPDADGHPRPRAPGAATVA